MKRHRKAFTAIPCSRYVHPLTKQLAEVLLQTRGDRFTRFDAFRSLLERQAVQTDAHPDSPVCRFGVTLTGLSREWGWHRHTVGTFLEGLEAAGVIKTERTTVCIWLWIPGLQLVGPEAA